MRRELSLPVNLDFTGPLVSTLVFFILLLLMPDWIYNPVGKFDSDTWLFTGFLFDYRRMCAIFPHSHSCDAVTIYSMGNLFYLALPVFYANLLLKLSRFVLFGSLLYSIVKAEFGRRVALWTLLVTLFYFSTLVAFSSDYSDGWLVLYLILTMYFLLKAFRTGREFLLVVAGVMGAVVVGASAQAFAYLPGLGLMLLIKEYQRGTGWAGIARSTARFAAGFILGLGGVWLLRYLLLGDPYLFGNSFFRAEVFLNFGRWFGPLNLHLKNNLLVLLVLLAYFFVRLLQWRETTRGGLVFFVPLVASVYLLGYMEFIEKQESLSCLTYINAILPFTALLLAWVLKDLMDLEGMCLRDYAISTLVLIGSGLLLYLPFESRDLASAATVVMSYQNPMPVIFTKVWLPFLVAFVLGAGVGFLLLKRKNPRILALAVVVVLANTTIWNDWIRNDLYADEVSGRRVLEGTSEWFSFVNERDPERRVLLWFNEEDETIIKNFLCVSHMKEQVIGNEMPFLRHSEDFPTDHETIRELIALTTIRSRIEEAVVTLTKSGCRIRERHTDTIDLDRMQLFIVHMSFTEECDPLHRSRPRAERSEHRVFESGP